MDKMYVFKNHRARRYHCNYCDSDVGSDCCLKHLHSDIFIYICPLCEMPTIFDKEDIQIPAPSVCKKVENLPKELYALYKEAGDSASVGAYTAAVLTCRKILMNIAVEKDAKEGKKFIEYVEFLADRHYVPPDGKDWVDQIRKKGNEATHEIKLMKHDDAKDLLNFLEMLLRFIFEFPARIPKEENK